MIIKPSAAIRQNYNEIADLCRRTSEPVFLTKNGEGDLVVMDMDTYNRKEKMFILRDKLYSAEIGWLNGNKGYTVEEVAAMMRAAVKEVATRGKAE